MQIIMSGISFVEWENMRYWKLATKNFGQKL